MTTACDVHDKKDIGMGEMMRPIHFSVGGPDFDAETDSWMQRARLPIIVALAIGSWGPALMVAMAMVAIADLLF